MSNSEAPDSRRSRREGQTGYEVLCPACGGWGHLWVRRAASWRHCADRLSTTETRKACTACVGTGSIGTVHRR